MSTLSLRALLERLPSGWATLAQGGDNLDQGGDNLDQTPVTGITEDSRRVGFGVIFVARRGRDTDGHRFIAQAAQAGAAAIVGEAARAEVATALPPDMPYWQARDGRRVFALLSAAFHDYPSRKMSVIGVTGTDGKTTTSTLIHAILTHAGIATGMISTIAARVGEELLETGFHVTTPTAFELQGYLARMVAAGCKAAVVETTSHALDQDRVAYVDYDIAVVTNITHEHLDWHGSREAYVAAKARLFTGLAASARKAGVPKLAVLNRDDSSFAELSAVTTADAIISYSLAPHPDAAVSARDVAISRDGTRFIMQVPGGSASVQLRLLGRFNVANALAAAAACTALGLSPADIAAGLGTVERVKGRMEWVYGGDFDVVVDFAHTPNALRQTLDLARQLVREGGRVIAVFGSAGLRDVAKRRMMGEIAVAADVSVLTAEDPRTEDVNAIIAEIATGLAAQGKREGSDYLRVPDRAEAITTAIGLARPGDLVVTCGKAHEPTMCYGTDELPWDEFAAVRAGLATRGIAPF